MGRGGRAGVLRARGPGAGGAGARAVHGRLAEGVRVALRPGAAAFGAARRVRGHGGA